MIELSNFSTTSYIYIVVSIFFILLLLSANHHRKVKKFLLKELPADEATRQKAAKFLGVETVVATGVSLFDVLYNLTKVDPFVLKGIDHLHYSQHFENLGDLISFMKSNIIQSEEGTRAWRQMIHKYKGYTGEEIAFDKFNNSGDAVEVPESGTNPGYDAIVNGKQVNVAITDDPSYIQEKLDRYPDIDVYTNKEMASAFGENPRVIVDPDLSSQNAFHMTGDTFSGINDLGDFMDNIPLVTLLISAAKNTFGVIDGRKDIGTAIQHTALDTAGVGIGGYLGSKIGLTIGLTLAPVTGGLSAILLPVISTFVGSLIGIFSVKGITNWFKERHLRSAMKHLYSVSENFYKIFIERFEELISSVNYTFNQRKKQCQFARKQTQNWFLRMFFPSPLAKFYSLVLPKLSKDLKEAHNYYNELKDKISSVEQKQGGLILFYQGSSILYGHPVLISAYKEVEKAVKQVEIEKQKLI